MNFTLAQISHKGGRERNEDRVGSAQSKSGVLLVLADGMGGHPDGEVAAQIAVDTTTALYRLASGSDLADPRRFLAMAVLAAHREILHHARVHGMRETPRTTLVVALVHAGTLSWAHCGDSRLYLVRGTDLLARTRDHSHAERYAHSGGGSSDHNRHVLFTCLGSPADPQIDLAGPVTLLHGDRVLLCSDGLWDRFSDDELARGLGQQALEPVVQELAMQALARAGAGSDNVSALALEWLAPDAFEETRLGSLFAATEVGVGSASLGAALLDWDAADMDRSIAEINEAIRRAAANKK